MLQNTVSFRKVMGFFFENFITDRHSILYSHFTVEDSVSSSLRVKMYFYDGIVEEKMLLLERHIKRFRKKKKKDTNTPCVGSGKCEISLGYVQAFCLFGVIMTIWSRDKLFFILFIT